MSRRSWGTGGLHQRKSDGRWVASVRMRDGSERTAYRQTREAAAAALESLVKQRDAGVVGKDASLGAYLDAWLADMARVVGPATWRKHETIVRVHITPALGRVRLSALTPSHVRTMLHRIDRHPQTVAHVRSTLRRALTDAQRDGRVMRNAAALAQAPAIPDRERAYLGADQVARLLAATQGDRLHALWVLGATCGLRLAEALALTWDDIDLDARALTIRGTLHRLPKATRGVDPWVIRPPKTRGSRRIVAMTPLAVTALRSHRLRQAQDQMVMGMAGVQGLVFTTRDGDPVHGPNVLPPLYRALAAAGLPRVTFHGLRHSAATVLLEAGVPLKVVSEQLGHSTIRITADLYAHVAPGMAMDAADRMQEILTRGMGGTLTGTPATALATDGPSGAGFVREGVEATSGFEPENRGFADRPRSVRRVAG